MVINEIFFAVYDKLCSDVSYAMLAPYRSLFFSISASKGVFFKWFLSYICNNSYFSYVFVRSYIFSYDFTFFRTFSHDFNRFYCDKTYEKVHEYI